MNNTSKKNKIQAKLKFERRQSCLCANIELPMSMMEAFWLLALDRLLNQANSQLDIELGEWLNSTRKSITIQNPTCSANNC